MDKIKLEEIEPYLSGLGFPVYLPGILEHAEENGASREIIRFLDQLPFKEYRNPSELKRELRKLNQIVQ